jgi:L-rhamnose isomerase
MQDIEQRYELAKQQYAEFGVDTEQAIGALAEIPISLHCWQGDDVRGFESAAQDLGGGLAVTGNYPGRARSADELRDDLQMALSLIPGRHRVNLHACYGEFGEATVDRDELSFDYFRNWVAWAQENGLGMDFNPTFFSHPKADDGFTLSHSDPAIRDFWVQHGIRCRQIGAEIGKALKSPCVTNIWIPDGYKDLPVDRSTPRRRLVESLDQILAADVDRRHHLDAVESKLFGIGSESYVVGSHEFYLGYAITNKILLCLDAGHFHPTETITDKISSVLLWLDELLLHFSRGIRWDSDHVVTLNDDLRFMTQELVRGNVLQRVHLALDFFDASINRVAAWVIGTRSTLKALLEALLEPLDRLRALEADGDFTGRLAILEEVKTLPLGAVWDYYCLKHGVPVGPAWLAETRRYETEVLSKRAFVEAT